MADERKTIYRFFYRKLLTLYPGAFRERFGESMEQTFVDLCNEQDGRSTRHFSLTLYLSIDTGIGIVKEHVLHFSKRSIMSNTFTNPRTTAILGLLLVLPGVVLLSLLTLGIEPPLGPLRPYLEPPGGSHVPGSLFVLALILVLPALGFMINAAAIRRSVLAFGNLAAAGALGLVVPFIVLQLVNRKNSSDDLPVALFGIMWLLASVFIAILLPMARGLRDGNGVRPHPVTIIIAVAVLAITAVMWVGLLNDQMPCFLGVPNCD